ncbi:MAG TPA: IclR family transcriptional regulator [Candidatus Acidoferrales bacterium]|nr:IclR family transcriptional regulator [Candidatus Acidoferrales bacterium]
MGGTKASPAVDRALNILEVISEGNSGLTNAYLARRLGIPKSSASSILRLLQNRGYLCRYAENGRYKLGFKILTLGRKLLENSDFRDLALPFMQDLVDRVDLTCHLAMLGQYEAVHLEKIVARRYFKQDKTRSVGERVPLHSSSVGKALLAWQELPVLEASLPSMELHKFSPRTITTRARLLAKLHEVRKQGYALDDEECRLGWRCVGAPIFDLLGSSRVAICLTGTVSELDDSKLTPVAVAVKETAQRISNRLASEHIQFATY